MDKKSHLSVIAAVLLVAVAAFALTIYSIWSSSKKRTTQDVAALYLSAILDGDKEAALDLIRLEVLCSGAGMTEEVENHLARYRAVKIRELNITVRDVSGSIAYNPGTEAADIRFEFRRSSETPWQTALIGLATFDTANGTPEFRAICWLWSADE